MVSFALVIWLGWDSVALIWLLFGRLICEFGGWVVLGGFCCLVVGDVLVGIVILFVGFAFMLVVCLLYLVGCLVVLRWFVRLYGGVLMIAVGVLIVLYLFASFCLYTLNCVIALRVYCCVWGFGLT